MQLHGATYAVAFKINYKMVNQTELVKLMTITYTVALCLASTWTGNVTFFHLRYALVIILIGHTSTINTTDSLLRKG